MERQICLVVCDYMAMEVACALHSGGHRDVRLAVFQGKCHPGGLSAETIAALHVKLSRQYERYIFLGGPCLPAGNSYHSFHGRTSIIPLEQCFELVLNREVLVFHIRQGCYLVTPGWLKNFHRHIRAWGFDNTTAKRFFRESMKKILLLDTGIVATSHQAVEELSRYVDLPYEILPVGMSHCQHYLDMILLREKAEIERHQTNIRLSRLTRESADYAVLFSQLKDMVDSTAEEEIIRKIFALASILFAPQTISFVQYRHNKPNGTFYYNDVKPDPSLKSPGSFEIELLHDQEILGRFRIDAVRFPAYLEQYKSMGMVIRQVASLAVSNARKFRIISEQKKKLSHYNHELNELNHTKDKFMSIIAHDLRSPFNGFISITSLMADPNLSPSPDELRGLALKLKESASAIYTLLENLLKWAQMQTGALKPERKNIPVKTLFAAEITLLSKLARKKEIALTSRVSDGLTVCADEKMLGSILRNLLGNAIKFTNHGGKIMLSAAIHDSASAIFHVTDDGIGMDEEAISGLFRIDVNKGTPGTDGEPSAGLGLTLCKEFVEKNGGKIWVESRPGSGSTFSFTIPLSPPVQ